MAVHLKKCLRADIHSSNSPSRPINCNVLHVTYNHSESLSLQRLNDVVDLWLSSYHFYACPYLFSAPVVSSREEATLLLTAAISHHKQTNVHPSG